MRRCSQGAGCCKCWSWCCAVAGAARAQAWGCRQGAVVVAGRASQSAACVLKVVRFCAMQSWCWPGCCCNLPRYLKVNAGVCFEIEAQRANVLARNFDKAVLLPSHPVASQVPAVSGPAAHAPGSEGMEIITLGKGEESVGKYAESQALCRTSTYPYTPKSPGVGWIPLRAARLDL